VGAQLRVGDLLAQRDGADDDHGLLAAGDTGFACQARRSFVALAFGDVT
jgi:hypothetical protein